MAYQASAAEMEAAFAACDEILASADKGSMPLVRAADEIVARLRSVGLAFEAQLPVRMVGVDPANRDGLGICAEDVHALGSKILALG